LGIEVTHSLDDVLSVAKRDVKTIGVVVAYGEVLPSAILEKVPMINVHFSLLPRWRGAAPVERAILAGDAKTGVCIMRVGEKLDEGEVYARREILINDLDTTDSLREKLNDLSVDLVRDAVLNGCGTGVAQAGEVLYAKKIRSSDLQIDWNTSATQILRQVRVGGAFSFVSGKRLKILQAKIVGLDSTGKRPGQICVVTKTECVIATADSGLSLIELQPEGKAVMQVEGWLNGARLNADSVFGS
jgi:methionyl-tRNA formyltransferase